MSGIDVIRAAGLAGTRHGFLGRAGGISKGVVAGLNVGFGTDDDAGAVVENRRRAVDEVSPGATLVSPHQVHSADAVIVAEPWPLAERPAADALVTSNKDLILGIVTADCAPVLFADLSAGVVGAAHAGWRGARDGVIESTVAAMERIGAVRSRIVAAIGPCIAQTSYEVDQEFRANFDESDARFFAAGRAGHFQFDLPAYVASRLAKAGITSIEQFHCDTYADEQRFFSYRRATHRGEPSYGRQFSLIGLGK